MFDDIFIVSIVIVIVIIVASFIIAEYQLHHVKMLNNLLEVVEIRI